MLGLYCIYSYLTVLCCYAKCWSRQQDLQHTDDLQFELGNIQGYINKLSMQYQDVKNDQCMRRIHDLAQNVMPAY
jgi:hypothetical protein